MFNVCGLIKSSLTRGSSYIGVIVMDERDVIDDGVSLSARACGQSVQTGTCPLGVDFHLGYESYV